MKVSFLTLSISRQAGGMMDCVRRPAQELAAAPDMALEVLARDDADAPADRPAWEPVPVQLCPGAGPASFGYARGMRAWLDASAPDLVHTFGLWTYQSLLARAWHRRTRRPHLVTPQGMLDRWALDHRRLKKRVVGLLYERGHLAEAACLHATSAAEMEAIRAFGLRNPVCIIPNGVDLPGAAPDAPAPWAGRVPPGRKVLLYLGRLHPKKGLDILVRAWAEIRARCRALTDGWCLVAAGWNQGTFQQELERLSAELGLGEDLVFVGPVFGDAKAAAYRDAAAFVLPSLSEGLPLTVLEAWSHRLPVLMTPHCHLPEGVAAGAAWRAEPEAGSLAAALETVMTASDADRRFMGERGRELVERSFTWAHCGAQTREVYDWVLGAGPRPACVVD